MCRDIASLSCTSETNAALRVNYNQIQIFFKKEKSMSITKKKKKKDWNNIEFQNYHLPKSNGGTGTRQNNVGSIQAFPHPVPSGTTVLFLGMH